MYRLGFVNIMYIIRLALLTWNVLSVFYPINSAIQIFIMWGFIKVYTRDDADINALFTSEQLTSCTGSVRVT